MPPAPTIRAAHDPLALRGRIATVLDHPLTIGRALLRARR
jgi:hypothetical protein